MPPARATRKRRSSGDNGDNGNSGEQPTANGSNHIGDRNEGDEQHAATPPHKRSARKGRGPMPYVSPGDEPLSPDLKASEL